MIVHVHTAQFQPATRQVIGGLSIKPFVLRVKPRSLVWCSCCERKRIAANARAQVYYDMTRYSCAPGKGCKS